MSVEPERYERLHAIFEQARELAPAERQALLAERCGADARLRREVEDLLAALDADAADLFSEERIEGSRRALEGLLPDRTSTPGSDWLPERVGRYRVLRRIGAGGMGVVYEAEQDSPRRRVALKLLHPQQATPERLRRFRHEAELLGRLQHPGVAQIHEAGNFDLGQGEQPFFAMELVEGVDVRAYVEREHLDVPGRLRLLARICDAVHHAHERGVVHRDLKPENVLVDGRGQPKVLDFGVARAAETSDVFSTLVTQDGVLMGTLAYMAPEQLAGDGAITPRTDVHALGVLAFELLSGRLPHELGGLGLTAAMRALEQEPPHALSDLEPGLKGDVETIVSKALAPEPERRYPSAEALATDLRRHLAHLPIAARPPSRAYRLRKYARRNRSVVAILAVLLLAAVLSSAFGLRSARDRRAAERRAYQSQMLGISLTIDSGQFRREDFDAVAPGLRGWEWRHLRSRISAPLRTDVAAREKAATAVGCHGRMHVTPDGRTLVLATWDGTVEWIELGSGAVLRSARFVDRPAGQEGVLATGRMAPGGEPGHLVLAEVLGRTVGPLVSSPAGPTWLGAGRVALWNPDAELPVAWHEFGLALPASLAIGGSPPRVLACDKERVFLVDPSTGARTAERLLLPGPEYPTNASFGAHGERIVVGDTGGGVWLLDAEDLGTLGHWQLPEPSTIALPALHPDGLRVAFSQGKGDLHWLDLGSEPPLHRMLQEGDGYKPSLAFSPDGRWLVAGLSPLSTWDARTCAPGATFGGFDAQAEDLAFAPDSNRLVTLGGGELRELSFGPNPFVLAQHTSYVYAATFSASRGLLATGGWDAQFEPADPIHLWDAATGAHLASIGDPRLGIVKHLAFDSSGERLIVSAENLLLAIELPTSRVETRVECAETIQSTALAPDGRRAACRLSVHQEQMPGIPVVVAVDLDAGTVLDEEELEHLGRLAWSPDGAWLAIGSSLRRASSFEVVARLPQAEEPFAHAFSPDGRRVVTSSARRAYVWSVPDGRLLGELAGHSREVLGAAFSPDGTRIATGGRDQTVRIWDAATCDAVAVLRGHESYVYDLAWSPDGETLASTSGDATVRLWTTETRRERERALRAREATAARLRPDVVRWLRELEDPDAVAAEIESRADWTPREREIAWQELLREPPR